MPPLVIALLLGAGAYAGYRTARQLWEKAAAHSAKVEGSDVPPGSPEATIGEKDLGVLEYDPATGVYRPVPRA